jgi:hypothetical protein
VTAKADDTSANDLLDTSKFQSTKPWQRGLTSKTVLWFYLPVAALLAVLTVYFALASLSFCC